MQTILGANGTIGKILAQELPAYTDRIRLVSRNPIRVNESDELLPLDLTQPGTVDKAVQGSDIVYLVVGLEYSLKVWEQYWPALMRDTVNACLKHGAKLVFFDNVYMYDKSHLSHLTENTHVNPPSRKGAVRKKISDMLLEAVRDMGLQGLIARSADFYGPGNENNFINQMVLKNLKSGKKPMWFVGPDIKHSFTYTHDAGKATALLGNTPDAYGQVWHLPTDTRPVTGKEFISMIASEFGIKDPKISILPKWMLRPLGLFIPVMKEMPEMMYQYDRDYFFDSSKFTSRFGIKATPYEEGVRVTCQAYRN
ncbi:MAG: NAD-dependent epimerase/dehydratase family protein [Bacteroidales bacterium]|jgi:nucleoside-diphosphate-sugar epimerase|nr:NAD-dependent epimerase/dehydratase family protein [Bacteroidales bacterium]NLD62528.1 NAD-dependent epimerase/dehydratase family protein [Bacteroidales bacterium]HNT94257.1 NAD-dependent epimerase/dehydratase family protein [Bacteroidales bacterium]HOO67438.1 NAD-dependent epimerase/dehydratase family protein [Bacteroidales bacterium]HPE23502.1 NAD-dependent epimerase/dehydratase family protein [Bacteroidales bacterium]